MIKEIKAKANKCFEFSYQTCHNTCGIHRLTKTKLVEMIKYYGDNYYLIGAYFKESADIEFEQTEIPEAFKRSFSLLEEEGIKPMFGKWNVSGAPNTILMDVSSALNNYGKVAKKIKGTYGLDISSDSNDIDERRLRVYYLASYGAGLLINLLKKEGVVTNQTITHFHEWKGSIGIHVIKKVNPDIPIVIYNAWNNYWQVFCPKWGGL